MSAQKEIGQDEEPLQESLTIRPDETEIILEPEGTQGGTATEAALDDVQLPGIGFGDILRFIAIFVILIFLAYFFLLLLRRLSGVKAGGKKLIRLISTQPLKGESALYIVEVASRFFLISSSSNSVNLITEFDDDSKSRYSWIPVLRKVRNKPDLLSGHYQKNSPGGTYTRYRKCLKKKKDYKNPFLLMNIFIHSVKGCAIYEEDKMDWIFIVVLSESEPGIISAISDRKQQSE